METSPRVSRLRRIRGACGATVAAVAALALLGWLTGWRVLAEVRPGYIPMAPNTAIGMIACGLGLVAFPGGSGGRSRRRRGVALLLTASAAAIALLRLTEYATGKNLGIDRWVLRVPGELLGLAPVGRMALMTAVGFVLAFVTLVLADLGESGRPPPTSRRCWPWPWRAWAGSSSSATSTTSLSSTAARRSRWR